MHVISLYNYNRDVRVDVMSQYEFNSNVKVDLISVRLMKSKTSGLYQLLSHMLTE